VIRSTHNRNKAVLCTVAHTFLSCFVDSSTRESPSRSPLCAPSFITMDINQEPESSLPLKLATVPSTMTAPKVDDVHTQNSTAVLRPQPPLPAGANDPSAPAAQQSAALPHEPVYSVLASQGMSFIEFPSRMPTAVERAIDATAAASIRGKSEAVPNGQRGIFVGQIPLGLTPARLAFAVNLVLGRDAVQQVTVAHNQACGWVCLSAEDADLALSRNESALVENAGVWLASGPAEAATLAEFCSQLKQKHFGETILKLSLPKAPMTLKPTTAHSVRPDRAAGKLATSSSSSQQARLSRHQHQQRPPLATAGFKALAANTPTNSTAQLPASHLRGSGATSPSNPSILPAQPTPVLSSTPPPAPLLPPPHQHVFYSVPQQHYPFGWPPHAFHHHHHVQFQHPTHFAGSHFVPPYTLAPSWPPMPPVAQWHHQYSPVQHQVTGPLHGLYHAGMQPPSAQAPSVHPSVPFVGPISAMVLPHLPYHQYQPPQYPQPPPH
jgi:hypothetical protein